MITLFKEGRIFLTTKTIIELLITLKA
ncbi:hypothetical protein BACI348_40321 [Bacillus altitudinis]|uniref:Uncharacterized protein n=1 Tax=Bacillus altitudinis TaxID=293387 RepID=A0A653PAK8_BACAB|nr:hypothetical protein BACI348_40321 [Bacillus altitudinis]